MGYRPCVIIPTYDNPGTIEDVVQRVHEGGVDVIVVDDGSGEAGRAAVERIAERGLAKAHRRESNGGKGAAVKDGMRVARSLGYTHALQVDADGQHALDDIPRFLEAARESPDTLILGRPVFDASAPSGRLWARKFTTMWTTIETGSRTIADPMCGFRVYPLDSALEAETQGNYMDFDPEIVVRMVWAGVPVANLETRVRYLAPTEGGVSHFRMFRDNARISWMHTRLVFLAILRLIGRMFGRGRP